MDDASRFPRLKKQLLLAFFSGLLSLLNMDVLAGGIERLSYTPWIVYVGAFGGYYTADYLFQGTYLNTLPGNPRLTFFAFDSFQQGGFGGVQLGIQRYFSTQPYFIGLVTSASGTGQPANLEIFSFFPAGNNPTQDFQHRFKAQFLWDIAGVLGFDITRYTHVYSKMGAVYQRLKHTLASQLVFPATPPTPQAPSLSNESYNYWGWLFGIGITQDINRWVNVFLEYDFYSYPTKRLITLNNFFPRLPVGETDQITQQIRIAATTLRLGLNVKFRDSLPSYDWRLPASWMFTLGGFAGQSNTDFQYQSTFVNTQQSSPATHVTSNDAFQQGLSGGGQIGIQYHFKSPFFMGLNFSAAADTQNTYISQYNNNFTGTFLTHRLRVLYDLGIAAVFGADITHSTHLYTRLGASMAHFKQTILARLAFPGPRIVAYYPESHNSWGVLWGVGLTRDINRSLNFFAEYDWASYGRRSLNTLTNIILDLTPLASQRDQLTQNTRLIQSTVRVGFNLKFNDPITTPLIALAHSWGVYVGGFTGYYSGDFLYGARAVIASTTITPGLWVADNDIFQQGLVGGGQVGILYHSQNAASVGLELSYAGNTRKANLAQINSSTFRFTSNAQVSWAGQQLQITNNLDITARLALDVTPFWHVYLKAGGSRARFKYRLQWQSISPPTITFLLNREKRRFWGGTFGLGATHDWNRRVSTFVEYDYYSYGRQRLNSLNNEITSVTTGSTITQRIYLHSYALRVGLNINFW